MKQVELWEIDNPRFLALIVNHPSGVVYTNQAGGVCCTHPELEGVLIPLVRPSWNATRETSMRDRWSSANDVKYVSEEVEDFLRSNDWDDLFEPGLNVLLGKHFGEAWVPVRIKPNDDPALRAFAGMEGVLTYANSD